MIFSLSVENPSCFHISVWRLSDTVVDVSHSPNTEETMLQSSNITEWIFNVFIIPLCHPAFLLPAPIAMHSSNISHITSLSEVHPCLLRVYFLSFCCGFMCFSAALAPVNGFQCICHKPAFI